MIKESTYSIVGIISFTLGVFNIIFSAIIFWALWSYINHMAGELLQLQVAVLNTTKVFDNLIKPLGLFLGIIGTVKSKNKKIYAIQHNLHS